MSGLPERCQALIYQAGVIHAAKIFYLATNIRVHQLMAIIRRLSGNTANFIHWLPAFFFQRRRFIGSKNANWIGLHRHFPIERNAMKRDLRLRCLPRPPSVNKSLIIFAADLNLALHGDMATLEISGDSHVQRAASVHPLFKIAHDVCRQRAVPAKRRGLCERLFRIGLDQFEHRFAPFPRERFTARDAGRRTVGKKLLRPIGKGGERNEGIIGLDRRSG